MNRDAADHFFRSMNHALVLIGGILCAAGFWITWRLPHSTLMIVTCTMLSINVVYDIALWRDRLILLCRMAFWAAVLQFLFGVLHQQKVLFILIPSLVSFYILYTGTNPACSCVSVIVGHLAMTSPGGFYAAASLSLDLLFSVLASLTASSFISLIHLPKQYAEPYPGPFSLKRSLRITALIVLGSFIMEALQLAEGIWIVLTAGFIYYSVASGGDPDRLSRLRVVGTPVGLYAGFLFLACFAYFNYQVIYTLPLWAALGFFILYYTQNYFVYTIFFMMSFCLYADFSTPQNGNIHIAQLVLSRSFATAVGVILIILFEAWFLPDAPKKETTAP